MNLKLFIILLLVSTKSFAQSFTLNELLKLRTGNYEQFETYVNQKGYEFLREESRELSADQVFALDETNGNAERFIRYSVYFPDKSVHISHQTAFLSDYNRLKQATISSGFVFQKTSKAGNATYHAYQKGERIIRFFTYRMQDAGGINVTAYEIAVN